MRPLAADPHVKRQPSEGDGCVDLGQLNQARVSRLFHPLLGAPELVAGCCILPRAPCPDEQLVGVLLDRSPPFEQRGWRGFRQFVEFFLYLVAPLQLLCDLRGERVPPLQVVMGIPQGPHVLLLRGSPVGLAELVEVRGGKGRGYPLRLHPRQLQPFRLAVAAADPPVHEAGERPVADRLVRLDLPDVWLFPCHSALTPCRRTLSDLESLGLRVRMENRDAPRRFFFVCPAASGHAWKNAPPAAATGKKTRSLTRHVFASGV